MIALGFGQPHRLLQLLQGKEDFDFPGTYQLKDMVPGGPDIIHCHNLHGSWLGGGGYFDLSVLARWSHVFPVVLTLHDAWMLSGHCAHSFECDRWKSGCGACPDLTIYPPVRRDATAFNWKRKQAIYAKSRLHVAMPSRWLMQKVQSSMLRPALVEAKVIPNGVDLSVFRPADKTAARLALGIPRQAQVLLVVAHGIRDNMWKDYFMVQKVVEKLVIQAKAQEMWVIALGEEAQDDRMGNVTMKFVPYLHDRTMVAQYYQAADVYLHAARADTFPHSVLEALACGVPVVATAVGGIPEQIDDGKTGFLVPGGDIDGMVERIMRLLARHELRASCGGNAVEAARSRFDLNGQVRAYLNWFGEIRKVWKADERGQSRPVRNRDTQVAAV
ncbi:MAG: Glycosyl transferase group 1 [Nitrospira sp.]